MTAVNSESVVMRTRRQINADLGHMPEREDPSLSSVLEVIACNCFSHRLGSAFIQQDALGDGPAP